MLHRPFSLDQERAMGGSTRDTHRALVCISSDEQVFVSLLLSGCLVLYSITKMDFLKHARGDALLTEYWRCPLGHLHSTTECLESNPDPAPNSCSLLMRTLEAADDAEPSWLICTVSGFGPAVAGESTGGWKIFCFFSFALPAFQVK